MILNQALSLIRSLEGEGGDFELFEAIAVYKIKETIKHLIYEMQMS